MSIPFLSNVVSKQIHITTEPAPKNLTESRLVLKALQKFGEVVYFYNLKVSKLLKYIFYSLEPFLIPSLLRRDESMFHIF